MRKLGVLTFVALLAVSAACPGWAAVYLEVPDAGQTLGGAQALPGGTDQVLGSVSGDADLFSFFWGGGDFYVNSVGSDFDSQLFLFNSAGVGLQGNDDGIASAGPAYLQLASLAAGQYYLGVSPFDYDPYGSAGIIFQSYPYQALYGPLNSSPLSYWWGSTDFAWSDGVGPYTISFQQITANGEPIGDPNPTAPAPEPGTLLLLGSGLIGIATLGRRKFKK